MTHEKKIGDISYLFCNDEKMLEMNRRFLQHDYHTDIITFDDCEGDTLNGDMIVSLDTVKKNATEYGVTFNAELCRVMIHGILHLCGFNDKTPREKNRMTRLENDALKLLLT